MGSCTLKKYQTNNPQRNLGQITQDLTFPRVSWLNKYTQQPQERIIQPYNPNSLEYQYNVEVEGVIFDVIAPPDFLDDDNIEPLNIEE